MAILERLLRVSRGPKPYYPFSEPRWRGQFPFGSAKRDIFHVSNLSPLYRSLSLSRLSLPSRQSIYQLYQDRRTWHPEGAFRPAVSTRHSYPKIVDTPLRIDETDRERWERISQPRRKINWKPAVLAKYKMAPGRLAFEDPNAMVICLERKMRKEVLHALGIAGSSHKAKIHNWNAYSHVRCF